MLLWIQHSVLRSLGDVYSPKAHLTVWGYFLKSCVPHQDPKAIKKHENP